MQQYPQTTPGRRLGTGLIVAALLIFGGVMAGPVIILIPYAIGKLLNIFFGGF